ncbi:LLM class flavin-dependent oxidoreductase [Gordonia crocea]|uniref:Monooxygenase n=1 Tax=Gordonia crocea TaxID=589162 RepID=A0A7I9V1A9_9ACTN|nr:LLM class flavin-dependent oxidoreductase [Gordonia crocea]GED99234.1 monooxygenase [Gordonia crocea]
MSHSSFTSPSSPWPVDLARPRFGVWAPVWGPFAAQHYPGDRFDASWEFNRRYVLEAERLGYDSTLVAQHNLNPNGHELAELEAWSGAAALAAVTSRIEIIAAIKPYLFHPVFLAKIAAQIAEIADGRFALNLVNAWYKPELEKAGVTFADHDDRYAYGDEWLSIVAPLTAGEHVTHQGDNFTIDDYVLAPADPSRKPKVYLGGESEPARDLAAKRADAWFINGQPLDVVRELIASVADRPRTGDPIEFGLSAFVIARETDEEAQRELELFWRLAEEDAPTLEGVFANADPKAVMFETFRKFPHIGTNGGTAAGLVGSYDDIAARLVEFYDAGIALFMLQFQPAEREAKRFAEHVFPRVAALLADRAEVAS